MPATNGFQLTDSDLPILQHVHELRLATIDHVCALVDRSYKRLADRLAKLEEHKYLARIERRPHKHAYTIGREGVPVLIEHGYAPKELAAQRLRQNELKELGIRHAVFISDIHVKLILLTRATGITISNWVEGPSLWDTVTTRDNVKLPIRPDAWFTIDSPLGSGHFFLEADRGTMAHSRMREKITAYAAWYHEKKHTRKYRGMKAFRVATITETAGRAEALTAEFRSIMSSGWLAAYPVIAFTDLTLDRLSPELTEAQTT